VDIVAQAKQRVLSSTRMKLIVIRKPGQFRVIDLYLPPPEQMYPKASLVV
jgi:hypothetical protein